MPYFECVHRGFIANHSVRRDPSTPPSCQLVSGFGEFFTETKTKKTHPVPEAPGHRAPRLRTSTRNIGSSWTRRTVVRDEDSYIKNYPNSCVPYFECVHRGFIANHSVRRDPSTPPSCQLVSGFGEFFTETKTKKTHPVPEAPGHRAPRLRTSTRNIGSSGSGNRRTRRQLLCVLLRRVCRLDFGGVFTETGEIRWLQGRRGIGAAKV